jgi:hypothetical protein
MEVVLVSPSRKTSSLHCLVSVILSLRVKNFLNYYDVLCGKLLLQFPPIILSLRVKKFLRYYDVL